jgi:hypothetical protein
MAARYGAETSVVDWRGRLVCSPLRQPSRDSPISPSVRSRDRRNPGGGTPGFPSRRSVQGIDVIALPSPTTREQRVFPTRPDVQSPADAHSPSKSLTCRGERAGLARVAKMGLRPEPERLTTIGPLSN